MKRFVATLVAILVLGIAGATAQAGTPLSTKDFKILSFDLRWEYSYLLVYGEVQNIGPIPAGCQVEVIVRDEAGKLVDVAKFWPNSTNNIPPGETCGFKHPVTRNTQAAKGGIKIISARKW
jgi:hypothetical protein